MPFNSIGKVGESGPAKAEAEANAEAEAKAEVTPGMGGRACRGALASAGVPAGTPMPRWKFFSPRELTDTELDAVLLCRTWHVVQPASYRTHWPFSAADLTLAAPPLVITPASHQPSASPRWLSPAGAARLGCTGSLPGQPAAPTGEIEP